MIASLSQVTLGFDDRGGGIPLVMLHGFPLDRTLWSQQLMALDSRARCIVPDLRGFGESSREGPFSMDQYADDVVSLMDWLEIEQAVVCGLSMGGYVAMAMWRRHTSRVRGLVLSDTRATADSDTTRATRNELIALAHARGAGAVADRQMPGLVGSSTRARHPEIVAMVRSMLERQPVAGIVGALAACRDRPDSRSTIATVTVPTLVVVGEEDVLTTVSEARAMIELLPVSTRAHLECIPEAGHVSCVERPAAFTHALTEFLVDMARELS